MLTTGGGVGARHLGEDLYQEKLTSYVNQRSNAKFSKESLARDFNRKVGNAFKNASANLVFDPISNQLKMPLMKQFGMMGIQEEVKKDSSSMRASAPSGLSAFPGLGQEESK